MSEGSARFALPYLQPGQAQKELFHNEALALIDLALHAAVEGSGVITPPENPNLGACWIVGAGATGAWSGHEHHIAGWTEGGWRFLAPTIGMRVLDKAAGFAIGWDGSLWSNGALAVTALTIGGVQVVGGRQAGVPSPSGGTTIDTEARSAIDAIIAALMSHGLIS